MPKLELREYKKATSDHKASAKIESNLMLKRQGKLASHLAVLQSYGYDSIDLLGNIELGKSKSKESLLQTSGVVLPTQAKDHKSELDITESLVPSPFGFKAHTELKRTIPKIANTVQHHVIQNAEPPKNSSGRSAANVLPLNISYWFANGISIGNDTEILIDTSVKRLVIITNNLSIGSNVKITWKQPLKSKPTQAGKGLTPRTRPVATGVEAQRPLHGGKGKDGLFIPELNGADAPEVEIWYMSLIGNFPIIDLKGQDGLQGQQGGDGGNGQEGQKGCPTLATMAGCRRKPGQGGNGGNGGAGGNGGPGGDAGRGGRLEIYTTSNNIISIGQNGFTPNLQGGVGGAGGDAGEGGAGGRAGKRGDMNNKVCGRGTRTDGKRGYKGAKGRGGQNGLSFGSQQNSLILEPITQADFNIALNKPAIISTDRQGLSTSVGDTVTVHGLRFSPTDKVFIQDKDQLFNIECATTYYANNLITFEVPNTIGGYTLFEVRQSDNTPSANQGTLLIRPEVLNILNSNRITPGSEIFIKGTGFDLNGSIMLNEEHCGPYKWVDYETIKYKVVRPTNIVRNRNGEQAKLKVINSEGGGPDKFNHSEKLEVVLDTFVILVLGDSSAWEAGNLHEDKSSSLLRKYIEETANIGTYVINKAHIGAIIGRGNSRQFSAMPGELATPYRTIFQQVQDAASEVDTRLINLTIIAGGANDGRIVSLMMTESGSPQNLQRFREDINKYCYQDLKALVELVHATFQNTDVLVRSYYHILSHRSNPQASILGILLFRVLTGKLSLHNLDVAKLTIQFNSLANNAAELGRVYNERLLFNNLWVQESTAKIQQAVTELNSESTENARTYFVDAATRPENAAHASKSILWEPNPDLSTLLGPTDPMLSERSDIIKHSYPNKNEARDYSPFFSKRDSSYHPNARGARIYFNKMKGIVDSFKKSKRYVLKANSGNYLSIDLGTEKLQHTKSEIIEESILELIDFGNGEFALKTSSGKFVCAEQGGGFDVNVNRTKALSWEMFKVQQLGNSQVALKTRTGHFLSAPNGALVHAQSLSVTSSEKFALY